MRNAQNDEVLEEEFEKIYSTYFQRMYLYARKLLKSDHLAEDVVEDVFFNLWKARSNLSDISGLETYLFVSVKNQVIRMISKDPNVFISIDIKNELEQIDQSNPEDILLEKELVRLIDLEINKLPERCQIIFRMARNEQKEYTDIAHEMGISVDSVKSNVYKATVRIRECVSQWQGSSKSKKMLKGFAGIILLILYFLNSWIFY